MYYGSKLRHTKAFVAALVALYLLFPGRVSAQKKPAQPFRLGTAAMPFGWATAVADLDSDQKLDFAVADRTSSGANGYNYRLELSLSHAENQIFQFRSSDSALNVSIIDLDDDADLDIVLTHALTGRIAGVWLNNGSGDFQQGNAEDFLQADTKTAGTVVIKTLRAQEALATLPVQRRAPVNEDRIRFDRPIVPASAAVSKPQDLHAGEGMPRFLVPRAPPISLLL